MVHINMSTIIIPDERGVGYIESLASENLDPTGSLAPGVHAQPVPALPTQVGAECTPV